MVGRFGFLEWRHGSEQHSSTWGKFKIFGLERWQVKENTVYDKHQHYIDYAANVPSGIVFVVVAQSGDKYGTKDHDFYICEVLSLPDAQEIGEEEFIEAIVSCYGVLKGDFKILCHGQGKTKAKKLEDWWGSKSERLTNQQKREYALICADLIEKRGYKGPPEITA